jgi:hypothetical protein
MADHRFDRKIGAHIFEEHLEVRTEVERDF